MDFLKKYWWAILLVVILGVVIYMMYAKKEAPAKTCNNTKAQWDAKLAAKITAIKANPEHMEKIEGWAATNGISIDQEVENNARHMLVTNDKECNPYTQ